MDLKIVPIDKAHKREEFDCGEETLNTYLKKYAKQSHRAGSVRTYVLINGDDPRVIGYYSICTGAVAFEEVPDDVRKGLGRYPVPCVLLTRLAVDKAHQGKKYSDLLIIDAFRKAASVRESVGAHLFILDALNEKARQIYLRYGFTPSLTDPMKLLLPMSTVESTLASLEDRAG